MAQGERLGLFIPTKIPGECHLLCGHRGALG